MNWSERLKDKVILNRLLSDQTTFKIGGASNFWFEPENLEELIEVYNFIQKEKIPLLLLGGGSNILVKDTGWRGMTVKLSKFYFKKISFDHGLVKIGAGQSLSQLLKFTLKNSLSGGEFLFGIPGTLGGAIMMNAGARDVADNKKFISIGDLVEEISVLDKSGQIKALKRKDIKFGYRHSGLNDYIIIEAKLKLNKGTRERINDSIDKFWQYKKNRQDFTYPSAGCIFKNPSAGSKSSGQLIDEAGFKGKKIGAAQVSLKHANFIINTGGAKARDVLTLMDDIQKKIEKDDQIWLEPEIKIIG